MKTSISNLTWGAEPFNSIVQELKKLGIDGIEIAPTALWPDIDDLSVKEIRQTRGFLSDFGIEISGIQSLLFGHHEFQLFDKTSWAGMYKHLTKMIEIASTLGAPVAVFGAPRNRVKGTITKADADEISSDFFSKLVPVLEDNNVVLTLEPNAPGYGADYLLSYADVLNLVRKIDAPPIAPQIDTGCLWMINEDPTKAFKNCIPEHIHLSTPNLGIVPGDYEFSEFLNLVKESNYKGWLVIESLNNSVREVLQSINWLTSELRSKK